MKSLIKKLIDNKISISVAESCTGGLLSSKITSISGASAIFKIFIKKTYWKRFHDVKVSK